MDTPEAQGCYEFIFMICLFILFSIAAASICGKERGSGSKYVFFLCPLLVQEAVQAALWLELDYEPLQCSWRNAVLTCLEMVIVVSLPAWWSWCSLRALTRWSDAVDAASDQAPEMGDESLSLKQAEEAGHGEPASAWLQAFESRAQRERWALKACVWNSLLLTALWWYAASARTGDLAVNSRTPVRHTPAHVHVHREVTGWNPLLAGSVPCLSRYSAGA